ncbi:MAG: YGL010W-like membrane protein [Pseudohongiellaceae bacterium]|jgi:uncharacterized membrane protein YGL010W
MSPTLQQLLNQYSASHQNPSNQLIHSIAVPLIYISVLGLCWTIPLRFFDISWFNMSTLATLVTLAFYMTHSLSLALGMLTLSVFSVMLFLWLESQHISVAIISISIFFLAWIAQFIGHGIEGKKPSFFEDLRFLLIGPGWVIAKLYRRLHISL